MARGGFRPTSPRRQGGDGGYGNGRRGGFGRGRHVWADDGSGRQGFTAADRAAMVRGGAWGGAAWTSTEGYKPRSSSFLGQEEQRSSAPSLNGRNVNVEGNLDLQMERQRDRSPPPEGIEAGRHSWADEMVAGRHGRDEFGRCLPLVSPASWSNGRILNSADAAAVPPTGEVIIGIPAPPSVEVDGVMRQFWGDEMEVSRKENGQILPMQLPANRIAGQNVVTAGAAGAPPAGEVSTRIPAPPISNDADAVMDSVDEVHDGNMEKNQVLDNNLNNENCTQGVCSNVQPKFLDILKMKSVAGEDGWPPIRPGSSRGQSVPSYSGGRDMPGDRNNGNCINDMLNSGFNSDAEMQAADKFTKCNISLEDVDGLEDIAPDGSPVAMVEEVTARTMEHFSFSIVGKIMGRRVPPYIIDAELRKRWELFGDFRFLMLRSDCFLCIFSTGDARDKVLQGGPWFINGFIVGLDVWTPTFDPTTFKGLTSPVWIRLPHLPLLFWDKANIARIAARIGKPLWIDSTTHDWIRMEYARVCVRVDLSKPLRAGIEVTSSQLNFFQKLEYEGIASICSSCGCLGHVDGACRLAAAANPARPPPARANARPAPPTTAPVPQAEDHHGPGPWNLVKTRRRRRRGGKNSNKPPPPFVPATKQSQPNDFHKPGPPFVPATKQNRPLEKIPPVAPISNVPVPPQGKVLGGKATGLKNNDLEITSKPPGDKNLDLDNVFMEISNVPPLDKIEGNELVIYPLEPARVPRSLAARELANLGPVDIISHKRRKGDLAYDGGDASSSRGQ